MPNKGLVIQLKGGVFIKELFKGVGMILKKRWYLKGLSSKCIASVVGKSSKGLKNYSLSPKWTEERKERKTLRSCGTKGAT